MNIAIVLPNYEKNKAGINRYTYGLLKELVKDNSEYYCYGENHIGLDNIKEIKTIFDNGMEIGEKEKQYLNSFYHIDEVISFYPAIDSRNILAPTMLVIYDLSPLEHPEWFANSKGMHEYFDVSLRSSAQMVDKIITISKYTKDKIIEYYGIPEEKIEIVYPAISEDLLVYRDLGITEEEFRERFDISGEYVLSICTLQPRKNLISLVKCFEKYKERNHGDLKLVLVGQLGWNTDKLVEAINNSKFSNDIILTGYVSDYEMACLYKKCLFFAYISYYEGFGMPILEAQFFGKAVLSSEATSMPEAGGKAACYCNPYDLESVYAAFDRLANDDSFREKLERETFEQARKFSYTISAQRMREIFEKTRKAVYYKESAALDSRIYKMKNELLFDEQWNTILSYKGIAVVRSARMETLTKCLNVLDRIGYADDIYILGRKGDEEVNDNYPNLRLYFFAIDDDEKYSWENTRDILNSLEYEAVLVLYRYLLTYEHQNLYDIILNSEKKAFCSDCEGNLKTFNKLDAYISMEEQYRKNCLLYSELQEADGNGDNI